MKKKATSKQVVVLALALAAIALFFFFPTDYLTLSFIKSKHTDLVDYYLNNKLLSVGLYVIAYIIMAAFSLPGAAVMSLAGASVFGFWVGLIAVSFASTIGATLAFLVSRYILRDTIQSKYPERLKKINEGIEQDGAFYLLTLRLIPVFPFFIINLVMGLTPIRPLTFYLVSQLGMLPGTAVYINAGTQLGTISSTSDILSPMLILSFVLLGIFPWIARFFVRLYTTKKALAGYKKPKSFDYNLIVIGAGSAGLVSAYIATTVNAKVCLIEQDKMGGDCLNRGCIPSKAIIKTAKLLSYGRNPVPFGIDRLTCEYSFKTVMDRVHTIIDTIAPHDSVARYTKLGVDCVKGHATVTSPYDVEVNGKTLSAKNIIIATGASPFVPPITGLENTPYLTSDSLWRLDKRPDTLVVLGGGPIGCELAQAFARLGSAVTIVEMADRLMIKEDPDVSALVLSHFQQESLRVLTGHTAKEVKNGCLLIAEGPDGVCDIPFDALLVAVGRKANTKGFGLETLGVARNSNGTIKVNDYLQSTIPTIYCAGDVAGPYQFTHTAAHQAWYASVNSLFGKLKRFKADYSVIPWATYTDPEVARVGLNETDADSQGIDYEVTRYNLDDLDRAITDSVAYGFIKVLTRTGTDKILGVTIVGDNAGNIISEYVLAMKHNIGLNKLLGTIHIYPTISEANKFVAGEWKKARKPEKALHYLKKYHNWMRG